MIHIEYTKEGKKVPVRRRVSPQELSRLGEVKFVEGKLPVGFTINEDGLVIPSDKGGK